MVVMDLGGRQNERRVRGGAVRQGANTAKGRVRGRPQMFKFASVRNPQQRKCKKTALELIGTFLVLLVIALGILTLRFAMVLMHGAFH